MRTPSLMMSTRRSSTAPTSEPLWFCSAHAAHEKPATISATAPATKPRPNVIFTSPAGRGSGVGQQKVRLELDAVHVGAEQALVCHSQPAADFPPDVHLQQGELLDVLLVDLEEARGRQLDRRTLLNRHHRGAARTEVHQGHLAEAVAREQITQHALLSFPHLQHSDLTGLQHEHGFGFLVLVEEELAFGHPPDGSVLQKGAEDLGAHTPEDGHPLQRLYPCLFHDVSDDKPDAPTSYSQRAFEPRAPSRGQVRPAVARTVARLCYHYLFRQQQKRWRFLIRARCMRIRFVPRFYRR